MITRELRIEGMSCGHCVMSIKKALSNLRGVMVEDVQIGYARVSIDTAVIKDAMLTEAIENAGYKLVGIQ